MKKSFFVTLCLLLVVSLFAYAQTAKKASEDQAKKPVDNRDPFGADPDSVDAATDPFGAPPKKKTVPPPAGQDPFGGGADPFGVGVDDRDPFGPAAPKRSPRQPEIKRQPLQPQAVRLQPATPAVSFPVIWLDASVARQRIEKALSDQTEFDFLDHPLNEVVEAISHRHELPLRLDRRAMEDFGIDTAIPITVNLKGITLRSALKITLNELDLTHTIRDEVLVITTPDEAEAQLETGFYRVADLLPENGETKWLVELITWIVEPDSWDEVGGPGSIVYIDHLETLVISQTGSVHHHIRELLGTLSKMPKKGQ